VSASTTDSGVCPENVERRPGRPRSAACDAAILRAALDEYAERGYEGLSVDAVAARAGVSKATIYRRYRGKTDLVLAAAKGAVFDEWVPPAGNDLRGDLRGLLVHLRGVMLGTTAGRATRMVVADSVLHPDLGAGLQGLVAQRRALARGIIEHAIARGDLAADTDAEVLTDMLSGPVFYRLFISGDPVDDAFLDGVVETALKACAP
jgi:AcrR family transcriptional regulator